MINRMHVKFVEYSSDILKKYLSGNLPKEEREEIRQVIAVYPFYLDILDGLEAVEEAGKNEELEEMETVNVDTIFEDTMDFKEIIKKEVFEIPSSLKSHKELFQEDSSLPPVNLDILNDRLKLTESIRKSEIERNQVKELRIEIEEELSLVKEIRKELQEEKTVFLKTQNKLQEELLSVQKLRKELFEYTEGLINNNRRSSEFTEPCTHLKYSPNTAPRINLCDVGYPYSDFEKRGEWLCQNGEYSAFQDYDFIDCNWQSVFGNTLTQKMNFYRVFYQFHSLSKSSQFVEIIKEVFSSKNIGDNDVSQIRETVGSFNSAFAESK